MVLRNYTGEDGSYNIFHFPTLRENLNIQFVNANTFSYTYKGNTYNLSKVDGVRFKLLNTATSLEKRSMVAFTAIINDIMTIEIIDDNFTVYIKKTVIIPIANILANDTDIISGGLTPLTFNSISGTTLGSAIINGSNIEYTNVSGNVGDIATITYEAQNENGDISTGTINITIEAIPSIICNPDTFTLQQGETLLLSKSSLSDNDIDSLGKVLTVQTVINPVNGIVSLNGDNISFTSTGVSGFPAEFEYTVTNTDGTIGTGKVFINVTPLPPIEALIYATDSDVQEAITNGYTPSTVSDIFNTWSRFDGNNYYANKDAAIAAENTNATAWEFLTSPDRVNMPLNVSPANGFISPDALDNYTFEVTLSSDSADNDTIGVVAAFNRDGTTNNLLTVVFNTGGTPPSTTGYGVYFNYNGIGATNYLIQEHNIGVGGGWSNKSIRVKVQRQGDIIKFYCTNWDDVTPVNGVYNYQLASEIIVDLNSSPDFTQFKGKKPYGYITYSQPNSTYLDININGGLDATKLYDIEGNVLWQYIDGIWTNTGTTIQEDLGYVRDATNPETGITYIIKGNEVIVKV